MSGEGVSCNLVVYLRSSDWKQKGEREGAAGINRDGGAMTGGEKFAGEL